MFYVTFDISEFTKYVLTHLYMIGCVVTHTHTVYTYHEYGRHNIGPHSNIHTGMKGVV